MFDFKKLREWKGITQVEMAELISISQGAYARIERGTASASATLINRIIERCTPTVLFISCFTELNTASLLAQPIATAMITTGQMDIIENDTERFHASLIKAKRIIVITNEREGFFTLIERALNESGLPCIPTQGIKIHENGQVVMWND